MGINPAYIKKVFDRERSLAQINLHYFKDQDMAQAIRDDVFYEVAFVETGAGFTEFFNMSVHQEKIRNSCQSEIIDSCKIEKISNIEGFIFSVITPEDEGYVQRQRRTENLAANLQYVFEAVVSIKTDTGSIVATAQPNPTLLYKTFRK